MLHISSSLFIFQCGTSLVAYSQLVTLVYIYGILIFSIAVINKKMVCPALLFCC